MSGDSTAVGSGQSPPFLVSRAPPDSVAVLRPVSLVRWPFRGSVTAPCRLPRGSRRAALLPRGFHNNNIKAIPERAFTGNRLLQTM